jgi:hypothetical protein
MKLEILNRAKNTKDDTRMKTLEFNKKVKIDMSKVVDLYDEDQMLEEIDPNDLIIED